MHSFSDISIDRAAAVRHGHHTGRPPEEDFASGSPTGHHHIALFLNDESVQSGSVAPVPRQLCDPFPRKCIYSEPVRDERQNRVCLDSSKIFCTFLHPFTQCGRFGTKLLLNLCYGIFRVPRTHILPIPTVYSNQYNLNASHTTTQHTISEFSSQCFATSGTRKPRIHASICNLIDTGLIERRIEESD